MFAPHHRNTHPLKFKISLVTSAPRLLNVAPSSEFPGEGCLDMLGELHGETSLPDRLQSTRSLGSSRGIHRLLRLTISGTTQSTLIRK